MSIASINPTTGQQLKIFPTLSDDVLKAKIIESGRVFQDYRHTSWTQRSQWLHRAASLLRDDRQSFEWAKLMIPTYLTRVTDVIEVGWRRKQQVRA